MRKLITCYFAVAAAVPLLKYKMAVAIAARFASSLSPVATNVVVSIEDVIDEINRLHTQGVQEVILSGVHLGGYGSDLGPDANLTTLIATILAQTSIPRIRLGSLEPWELSADFFQLFTDPRLMPHLHLPLQSGSDAILRRMARRCKTADFRHLADQARQMINDLNLTTDIIVGFPGEDELCWQQTLDFVETIGFGHLHIFPYSPRTGTKAATLPAQIDRDTKRRRVAELHDLGHRLKQTTLQRYIGHTVPVLWETGKQTQGSTLHEGYTPNFLRVSVSIEQAHPSKHSNHTYDLSHQIRAVQLSSINDGGTTLALRGELINNAAS